MRRFVFDLDDSCVAVSVTTIHQTEQDFVCSTTGLSVTKNSVGGASFEQCKITDAEGKIGFKFQEVME